MAREAVARETPARRATSSSVGDPPGPRDPRFSSTRVTVTTSRASGPGRVHARVEPVPRRDLAEEEGAALRDPVEGCVVDVDDPEPLGVPVRPLEVVRSEERRVG